MSKKPENPPFLHGNGCWCKKYRGKAYYYGTDQAEALELWEKYREYDRVGKPRPLSSNDLRPTFVELGNLFLADMRSKNAVSGKPGLRHIELCEGTLKRVIELLGRDARPEAMRPDDWGSLKLRFFEPVPRKAPVRGKVFGRQVERRSPETVAGDVRRVRLFLKWCSDHEHIAPIRFGSEFKTATKVAFTKESLKAKMRRKDFSAAAVRKLITKCPANYLPILLLGLNAGVGGSDIAAMTLDDIEGLRPGFWLDLPRLKTGVERRFPLWPETIQAIEDYLKIRPKRNSSLLFLTSRGNAWIRGIGNKRIDTLGNTFTKLRLAAGLKRGSYYDCRRTFQTVADELKDFAATRYVMGHAKPKDDMSQLYNQNVSDERIAAVVEHVRKWTYGG